MDWIGDQINSFINWVVNGWNGFIQWLSNVVYNAIVGWNVFWGILGRAWDHFWRMVGLGYNAWWAEFWRLFNDGIQIVGNNIANAAAQDGNFWQPFAQFLVGALKSIGEGIEIGRLVLEVGRGLFELLGRWITQSVASATSIFDRFSNATPLPIDGLPRCVTAPMQHEYCSLIYISEHTVFQGQAGDIIIGIVIALIDMWILFYVIRFVLKLLQRGQTVTND